MWIRNCWQVAAIARELGQGLLARTIMDERLLLFRDADGRAVALEDRCPHRIYPLSRGRYLGGTVECGYHGMRFDGTGRCVAVPVVERYGWVWVWIGDAERADAALVPTDYRWTPEPGWKTIYGYTHFASNYQLLVDNLLDLSHETFVHPDLIGNRAVADAPVSAQIVDDRNMFPLAPETPTSTHMFWAVARNNRVDDEQLDAFMLENVALIQEQDRAVLEEQQRLIGDDPDVEFPVSIGVDAGPTLGRRLHDRFLRTFVAVVVAVLMISVSSVRAQNLTTLTIGATSTDDTTPILYAQQAGLFRRAGLNVDVQKVNSGAAGMAAVAGGSLSLSGTNVLSMLQAHLKGVPLVMTAPGGIYNATTEFVAAVAKTANPIRTGRDLNGKVVGVASVGDLNAVALMAWIDSNGGDSKTVRQVEIPYATIPAALDENRIEVGTLLQPILSQAVDSGKVRIFAKTYDAIAPRFLITAWITSAGFANANADAIRRFARVMREAEIYCNSHKAETAPLLAAFAGVEVAQVLKGGRDTYAANFLDARDIQPMIESAFKYGVIERRFDAAEMFSPVVRGLTP